MNSQQGNVGHTFIDPKSSGSFNFSTITLNEIGDLIPYKEAIMKIDIESFECVALQAADELFDKLLIHEVFMELNFGITGAGKVPKYCVEFMLDFFAKRNFTVHNIQGKPFDNKSFQILIKNLYQGIIELTDVVWKLKQK